jgi:D-lactate dehydrogenase
VKVAVFSTRPYTQTYFEDANAAYDHELVFLEPRLDHKTASLAAGFPAVCIFVNDVANAEVLAQLHAGGTRIIALRCAGFNNVDLSAAERLQMQVARVPAYSPYAVAEHTIALILALNRKIHRAYNRVREGNFALEGLLGFDLNGKTAGVIGTGRIGEITAGILRGFGCRVLAHDVKPREEVERLGVEYVPLAELLPQCDVVTLHCPLVPSTHHLIGAHTLMQMKRGAMLINTSRGALIDTRAVIAGLKGGQIGALGLDVYEEEADLFFQNLSDQVLQDDIFARLLTFPNVIITGHQAFFTAEALTEIAHTTLTNIRQLGAREPCANRIGAVQVQGG